MSTLRELSLTSDSRSVKKSNVDTLPGAAHPPFTSSYSETSTKQLALENGGRNKAIEVASFSGTGKQRVAGRPKNATQLDDDPLMSHPGLAPTEVNGNSRNSTSLPQEWKPSTPHIAALLAVSRSVSIQSTSRFANPPARQMNFPKTRLESTPTEMKTGTESAPTTNALIKKFESQKDNHSSRSGKGFPLPQTSKSKVPKPIANRPNRTRSVKSDSMSHDKSPDEIEPSVYRSLGERQWTPRFGEHNFEPVPQNSSERRLEYFKVMPFRRGSAPPPPLPPPRRSRKGVDVVMQVRRMGSTSTHISEGNPSPSSLTPTVAGLELPLRNVNLKEETPSSPPFISLVPNEQRDRPERPSISPLAAKKNNGKDDHLWVGRQYSRESILDPRSRTPRLTADSLANAMVASSLASSRASSPNKPTPPLPHRQSKTQSFFRRSQSQELVQSRTPSPGRVLRQTMRETPKSDEELSSKRARGNILNKHPNKHHEGDRKRWRDEIAERERKRYEGVWAANKGLLVPVKLHDAKSTVLDLVVRDIWRRSRLPNEVLAEVWDLVNDTHVGRLSKEQFVVGMWLIDQTLKGRKLPVKVSESVWFSVKRLSGLKAPK